MTEVDSEEPQSRTWLCILLAVGLPIVVLVLFLGYLMVAQFLGMLSMDPVLFSVLIQTLLRHLLVLILVLIVVLFFTRDYWRSSR